MEKIRILYVVHNLLKRSGVSSVIMNYYKKLDHNKFQIDFLVFKKYDDTYDQELIENGSHIYYLNSSYKLTNHFKIIGEINTFFKNNKYDIIELHSPTLSYLMMKQAYKNNMPIRIIHTHSTIKSSNKIKNILNGILNINFKKYFNVYFSCSKKSGEYWFNKKILNSDNYKVITNGIDVSNYNSNLNERKKFRKEFNIDDKIVIGFVGRMSKDKNLKFLIDSFSKLKNNNQYKLVFVGDGNIYNDIQKYAEKKKVNVLFLGHRNDVNKLLNMFDLLVLPSKREGLPMVAVEAQMSGLQCFLSDTITKEVNIGGVKFLPLNKSIWVNELLNFKKEKITIDKSKFDIDVCSRQLEKIYIELFKKCGD